MSFSYLCQKVLKNLITTIARKWESPQIVVFRLSRLVSRQHLSSDNPALKGPIFCQKRELCTFDNNNKKAASNKCKTTISNVGMKYAREECGGTKLN